MRGCPRVGVITSEAQSERDFKRPATPAPSPIPERAADDLVSEVGAVHSNCLQESSRQAAAMGLDLAVRTFDGTDALDGPELQLLKVNPARPDFNGSTDPWRAPECNSPLFHMVVQVHLLWACKAWVT